MPLNPYILKAAQAEIKKADTVGRPPDIGYPGLGAAGVPVAPPAPPAYVPLSPPGLGAGALPISYGNESIGHQGGFRSGYRGGVKPVQPPSAPVTPIAPSAPSSPLQKIGTVREFFKRAASLVIKFAAGDGSMVASGVPTGPPAPAPNRLSGPALPAPPMGVTTSQGAPVPPGPAPQKLQMPQQQQK